MNLFVLRIRKGESWLVWKTYTSRASAFKVADHGVKIGAWDEGCVDPLYLRATPRGVAVKGAVT